MEIPWKNILENSENPDKRWFAVHDLEKIANKHVSSNLVTTCLFVLPKMFNQNMAVGKIFLSLGPNLDCEMPILQFTEIGVTNHCEIQRLCAASRYYYKWNFVMEIVIFKIWFNCGFSF